MFADYANLIFTTTLTLAYLFAMLSFLFKKALTLRIVFAMSSICSIIAGLSLSYLIVLGNIIILIINLTLITIMYIENRPVKLDGELLKLHEYVFNLLTPYQLTKLSKFWDYAYFKKGDILISDGERCNQVYLIIDGHCDIIKADRVIAEISQYQFVGEMQLLTHSKAIATVKAKEDIKCITISRANLKSLKNKNSALHMILYSVMSENLVTKIKKMNISMAYVEE